MNQNQRIYFTVKLYGITATLDYRLENVSVIYCNQKDTLKETVERIQRKMVEFGAEMAKVTCTDLPQLTMKVKRRY